MPASTSALSALKHLVQVFTSPDTLALVSRLHDGHIVALSEGFTERFGIDREDAIGRTAVELGLWRDAHNREGALSQLIQRGCVVGEPVAMSTKNSGFYDGLLTASLIDFGGDRFILALVQDIRHYGTESAARVRESKSNRGLLQDSEIGVYRRSASTGELLDANPALAELLGFGDTQALHQALRGSRAFPYADLGHSQRIYKLLIAEGRVSLQNAQVRRPDGSLVWVSESARTIYDGDHQPLYFEGTLVNINDRVHAEQALAQSESLYRNLVENSRDGVFLMQHGRVLFANDALGEILQYSSEEMVGASYFDWVAPEDLLIQAQRRSQRETGSFETQDYEIHLLRRDGQRRLCAVRAGAVEYRGAPASIGTLRDITDARAQQQRLEAAEERYRLLFRHAVLGMFQTTMDGKIIEVNEAMARMFGFESPEQMVAEAGSMSRWYVDPQARDRAIERLAEHGQIIGEEFELYRRNGERFWALSSTRIVRHNDGDLGRLEGSLLDNSARRAAEQELRFLAHHDSLTGLPSRRSFENELGRAIEASLADDKPRALLLLDLDRFKLVNDSLGHAAGDELLVKFAERISRALDQHAILARYGGDEFALLSRQPAGRAEAEALARAVQQILVSPFHVRGHQVFTGASIGIVLLQAAERQAEDLMRDADTAMFRAKANGGACHAFFDSHMHSAARERLALETELRFALERGEIEAWYQPMWSLQSQQIVGVEALARWRHPQRGLLVPASFLNIAEESGILPAIDLRILELSLRRLEQWRERFGERAPKRLSVNVSDRLFTSVDFPATLKRLLMQSQAPAQVLHLEITETVFRGAAGSLRSVLSALKRLGVKLVVDDFGTGYSSLVSFSESDFDGLKIDRGFIHDLESNHRHRAIVRTITQFALDLELSVVAEGVETDAQVQLIREAGCEVIQGWWYAPALTADALAARLGAEDAEQSGGLEAKG